MFSNLPRGSYMDEHISRDYGQEVLLSNWQERRQGREKSNAYIVPGLHQLQTCEEHVSEHHDNYTPPWSEQEEAGGATRHYLGGRNESLHNWMRNREVQLRFPLADDMIDNCTTTYKIMFDILPKSAVGQTTVCSVPSPPQDVDLMLSYGNRSATGARCQRRAEQRLREKQRMQTTYAAEFR